MLQNGSEPLFQKLNTLLKESLAEINTISLEADLTFILKPGRTGQNGAKSLRLINLMSFMLKTLKRLLDRHIRDDVLSGRSLHKTTMRTKQVNRQRQLYISSYGELSMLCKGKRFRAHSLFPQHQSPKHRGIKRSMKQAAGEQTAYLNKNQFTQLSWLRH